MKYKLAPTPPSLLDGPTMRKTAKSALADVIETKLTRTDVAPTNCVVVDGCFLLHKVVWPKSCTYQVVLSVYISCVITNYSEGATVAFDGYEGPASTKMQEQNRRCLKLKTLDVVVDLNLVVSTSQSDCLSNSRNKAMLIKILSRQLQSHGLVVLQAAVDADALIVMTAPKLADNSRPVTVVASDTYILAMLTARTQPKQNIFFVKPGTLGKTDKVFPLQQMQEKVGGMKNVILFLHAITSK